MAKTPEGEIEKYLLERCRESGLLCLKFVSPSRGGVPDRIVITPHATVFVELKSKAGRLSRRQHETQAAMQRAGARIYVAATKPEVDAIIDHLRDSSAALPPDGETAKTAETTNRRRYQTGANLTIAAALRHANAMPISARASTDLDAPAEPAA